MSNRTRAHLAVRPLDHLVVGGVARFFRSIPFRAREIK